MLDDVDNAINVIFYSRVDIVTVLSDFLSASSISITKKNWVWNFVQYRPAFSASFNTSFAESENVQFTIINKSHASVFRMRFNSLSSPGIDMWYVSTGVI